VRDRRLAAGLRWASAARGCRRDERGAYAEQ
jgi:hypothetical protein